MQTVAASMSDIRESIGRITRSSGVIAAGPLLITRAETSNPHYQISEPLFILMAQGGKRIFHAERTIDYLAGECLVVTTTMPLTGHFIDATPARPALAVSMRLKSGTIADLLPEVRPKRRITTVSDETIGTLAASPRMLDAISRLLELRDDDNSDSTVLAPLIEREIVWRLLTGPLGASVAQIGLAHSAQSHIARTISWMRVNLAEPMPVAYLADMASMSTSTFYRHFRRMTGMAPLQFHQHLRLHQARSQLLAGRGTVTAVAHSVGYGSPTQFSRDYRRLFGLPPGRDAERLRR